MTTATHATTTQPATITLEELYDRLVSQAGELSYAASLAFDQGKLSLMCDNMLSSAAIKLLAYSLLSLDLDGMTAFNHAVTADTSRRASEARLRHFGRTS